MYVVKPAVQFFNVVGRGPGCADSVEDVGEALRGNEAGLVGRELR